MKITSRMPPSISALTLFFLFFLPPTCTAYSSSDRPETYVARNTQVNLKPHSTLIILSALQVEDSTGYTLVDSSMSSTTPTKKQKHPFKAMAFAVVPGVILHGSGHFYAERYKTAVLLLGCEGAGIVMMVFGGLCGSIEIPETGGLLFLGSWLYDFIAAPLKVYIQNQPQPEEKDIGMGIRFKDKEPKLVLQLRF